MTDLNTLGVTELTTRESESTNGGSDFSYALGYTFGNMIRHPIDSTVLAWNYYFG